MSRSENGPDYLRGMLSFLILHLLMEEEMYGSEIARKIEKLRGIKPNPGTLYPALKKLKRSGSIMSEKRDGTVIYSLTLKGRSELETATAKFVEIFGFVFENYQKKGENVEAVRQTKLDVLLA